MPDNYNTHTLYEKGGVDVPEAIKDRNGDIVLGLCKVCGAGEIQLEQRKCKELSK